MSTAGSPPGYGYGMGTILGSPAAYGYGIQFISVPPAQVLITARLLDKIVLSARLAYAVALAQQVSTEIALVAHSLYRAAVMAELVPTEGEVAMVCRALSGVEIIATGDRVTIQPQMLGENVAIDVARAPGLSVTLQSASVSITAQPHHPNVSIEEAP